MVLAFADEAAARGVTGGKGWLTVALRTWNIEVVVVELDEPTRTALVEAQKRQVMVNPEQPQSG